MKAMSVSVVCLMVATSSPALAGGGAITAVVVHSDRAQVTRHKTARCADGVVAFAGLPSSLMTRSLRASAGGGRVLGVTWAERAAGHDGRVEALLKKVRAEERQMIQLRHGVARARAGQEKLAGFKGQLWRAWAHQAAGAAPPVKAWSAALDLLRGEALAAARKREALDARLRELERRVARLRSRIRTLEGGRRRTSLTVRVLVRCRGAAPVHLSYLVPGASWRMVYEARVRTADQKLTLAARAVVRQGTGEDWPAVALSVSTVNIRRRNRPPRITALAVRSRKPPREMKVLDRRVTTRRRLAVARATVLASALAAGPAAPPLVIRASARVSVRGDGREVIVPLASATPPARLSLEAAPKALPLVYRRLATANPFPFTLLPGQVSVFCDGAFIGRAHLEQTAPREPLALSLGASNQVRVRRYVKVEKHVPAAAFRSRRLVHRYRIQVDNWTRTPRTVTVRENLPVSRVKEIEVLLGKETTPPTTRDARTGLLGWTLTIPPRSKRFLTVAYTVSLPKDYHVAGY